MPFFRSRLWTLGFVAPLIAGCGGKLTGIGGSQTVVTISFQPVSPVAVATKTGSGAFKMAAVLSNAVTISVPEGTTDFAVAYLCPSYTASGVTFQRQFVFEASVEDGTAFDGSCINPATIQPPTGTLSGTVDATAIPGTNLVWLFGGNGTGRGLGGTVENISVQLPVGSDDVVALADLNTFISGGPVSDTVLAIKDLGEQAVPGGLNGGNPIVLSAADETTQQPITYSNAPSGPALTTDVVFVTAEGGAIPLLSSTNASYPAVPGAMLQGNAHYTASSIAGDPLSSAVSFTQPWNNGGRPLTVVFPPIWAYAGPAPAALPVFDFSSYSGFSGVAGVARVGTEGWTAAVNALVSYQVTASANSQNGTATVTMPDLSGLMGFLAVPLSGTTVSWRASISQNSAGAIGATPLNSSTQTAQSAGQFVVP